MAEIDIGTFIGNQLKQVLPVGYTYLSSLRIIK